MDDAEIKKLIKKIKGPKPTVKQIRQGTGLVALQTLLKVTKGSKLIELYRYFRPKLLGELVVEVQRILSKPQQRGVRT